MNYSMEEMRYYEGKRLRQFRVAIAISVTLIVICAFAVYILLNSLTDSPHGIGERGAANVQNQLPRTGQLYSLTTNEVSAYMSGSRVQINGHFWHELTAEQLQVIFPEFDFSLAATAHYYEGGKLFEIAAVATTVNGEILTFNEIYTLLTIQIAPYGYGIMSGAIFDFEPTVSYVNDVPVVVGILDNIGIDGDGVALFFATFEIDGISYKVRHYGYLADESAINQLTEVVNTIIRNGVVDLSVLNNPVVPELRNETLTLFEAQADPDFGAFVPVRVPNGFEFDFASRHLNQITNSLMVGWHAYPSFDSLWWQISKVTEHDRSLIVSPNDREKFDLALYQIPWMNSVPEEFRDYVMNPVFLAEDITREIVQARGLYLDEPRDPGFRINFSVLFDDILVRIDARGISPEQVWQMISDIK